MNEKLIFTTLEHAIDRSAIYTAKHSYGFVDVTVTETPECTLDVTVKVAGAADPLRVEHVSSFGDVAIVLGWWFPRDGKIDRSDHYWTPVQPREDGIIEGDPSVEAIAAAN